MPVQAHVVTRPAVDAAAAAHAAAELASHTLSRFAAWRSLESAADRWASYGALCLGFAGAAVAFAVL